VPQNFSISAHPKMRGVDSIPETVSQKGA